MTTTQDAAGAAALTGSDGRIVNDFTINVATINGTGSQTSNIAIMRAMFRMGIPVAGKNFFPSNIQGLPTWYKIRVNKDGYTSYRDLYHVVVLMNPATAHEDHDKLLPGGVCFYDEALRIPMNRTDITYYPMPVKDLVKEMTVPPSLRSYIANMVYVGYFIELLGVEREEIRKALDTHFSGKQKAVDLNMKMIDIAAEHVRNNIKKQDPYWVERMEGGNANKILLEGNEAGALGSVFGGVSVIGWYPITPGTSFADGLNEYLPKLRMDPETGKPTYAVIQAEDELAAIGMCLGAGWAGARSVTSTSGPGISLMAEFAGLGYFAEIPTVVWDVQRVGPSTGLPTRTGQCDILFTYYLSHGDTKQVVLLPANPNECFEFGYTSLDLAETLQTPVFVLSDLEIGMNMWMSDPLEYPEQPMQRGKVLSKEQLDELGTKWGRFVDTDGDGIPYRTIPGTEHPLAGYFTRGTGHNAMAVYSERPEDWEENLQRIERKFETAREKVPQPVLHRDNNSRIGVISLGANHLPVMETLDMLDAQGMVFDYMRVRALPPSYAIRDFITKHDRVFVIENNQSGQMKQILTLEFPEHAGTLESVSRFNGLPLSPDWLATELPARYEAFKKSQN
ncbi:MAG: 2-oxoacid:acceptor oxidoreductase subunit alpha [Deltaproteobacteria bacterium]|nr:MAG: 2-oxoacid:acceptor oxidoreductase subunit alpha [Deltaproteobacteria bacterium]